MKVFRSISRAQALGGSVLLGSFDGFHRGHQSLILAAREPRTVVSFYPHPRTIIRGDKSLPKLSSVREAISVLTSLGVSQWYMMRFSKEISQTSAEDFLCFIESKFAPKELVVGADARVGKDGRGDVEFIKKFLTPRGVTVTVANFLSEDGSKIGSAGIRSELEKGEVAKASQLLGRVYELEGRVIHGDGRGKAIGFPTANIAGIKKYIPANGVYVTELRRRGSSEWMRAVTNIGVRPTFGENKRSVETHILQSGMDDFYDEWVSVRLLEKIRNEMKFSSVDALKAQISKDVALASSYVKV